MGRKVRQLIYWIWPTDHVTMIGRLTPISEVRQFVGEA
jgi:hypothetical protein